MSLFTTSSKYKAMKQRYATGDQTLLDGARASSYGGLFILFFPIFLIIFLIRLIRRIFGGKKEIKQNSTFNPKATEYSIKTQYLKDYGWIELSPMTFQRSDIELLFATSNSLEVYKQNISEPLGKYSVSTLADLIRVISTHAK